jgi:hypothetical protein
MRLSCCFASKSGCISQAKATRKTMFTVHFTAVYCTFYCCLPHILLLFTAHFTAVYCTFYRCLLHILLLFLITFCFILRCECKSKELPEFCNVYEYQFSAKNVHPGIILRSLMLSPILCYYSHHIFALFKLNIFSVMS